MPAATPAAAEPPTAEPGPPTPLLLLLPFLPAAKLPPLTLAPAAAAAAEAEPAAAEALPEATTPLSLRPPPCLVLRTPGTPATPEPLAIGWDDDEAAVVTEAEGCPVDVKAAGLVSLAAAEEEEDEVPSSFLDFFRLPSSGKNSSCSLFSPCLVDMDKDGLLLPVEVVVPNGEVEAGGVEAGTEGDPLSAAADTAEGETSVAILVLLAAVPGVARVADDEVAGCGSAPIVAEDEDVEAAGVAAVAPEAEDAVVPGE